MLRADRAAVAGPAPQPFRFVLGMLEHARENHRLFLALVGKRSGQLVLQRFRELVLDLIREDLARLPGKGQAQDMRVHFVGGAFLELLTWWLEARNPLEPAELEPVITISSDTALVTYSHPHQLITDVWVRREAAWRRVGRWESAI